LGIPLTTPLSRLSTNLADRYTIERELGQGGMATVYLAHDLKHHRKVAVKVLRPELAAVIGAERFLAEIKTTANLQHPHILALFDSGEVNGTVFYVMPFVEGESLRDRLTRERQLSIADAVRIAREVASALDYAHRHDVIHRDIKPENILLHDGQAMVADFGIALAASRSNGGTRMTETGMSLGTPHYMSPEQAMGERDLDARTDVYALGCVLYEMLTGEPPFTGPSAQAIVAKVMTERPTAPSATRDTVPEYIEDAVMQALAKLPVDRFPTAAAFATSLSGEVGTGATRSGVKRRAARPDRRVTPALIGIAALLLVAAVLGWTRSSSTAARTPLAYEVHLTQSEFDPAFVATQVAISPDGSAIVFSDTIGGQRQLWIKERGSVDAQPIPGTQGGMAPFLSPDGAAIAFTVGTRLLRIPRAGGATQLISDSGSSETSVRGTWLDNGSIVFLGGAGDLLFEVSSDGGIATRLRTADELQGFPVLLSAVPGEAAVLVTSCDFEICANPVVALLRLDPLETTFMLPGSTGAWALSRNELLHVLPDGSAFVAPFDVGAGTVGAGTPLFADVTIGVHGPELAVGRHGAMLNLAGGGGLASNRAELMLLGFDGSSQVVDSGWSGSFANNSNLELSSDGRRLLLSMVNQDGVGVTLYQKPYPTGPATQFATLGLQNMRAVWSPDRRHVAWISSDTAVSTTAWRQAADGSGVPERLFQESRNIFEVRYSPDGEWLLFRTDDVAAGRGDILARRTRGDTSTIPIAVTEAEETSPNISPDGRWIAYVLRMGTLKEVVVHPFPNVAGGRAQVSDGGGSEPLWSADGRTLYYRNQALGQILAAQMDSSGGVPVGPRTVVRQFTPREYWDNDDARMYELAPDGTGLLMMRRMRNPATSTANGRLILREHILRNAGAP
jgi:Tol biopolymer transport system component/tRNA A-37 threonylcarbamoyl transferase component Bud32